ncbi:Mur ligase [Gracilaria domingensis]|nr:Mur ligase [Gracilaria domingensis]
MSFIRPFEGAKKHSSELGKLLHRLENLVDWETRRRKSRDGERLMRVSAVPAQKLLGRIGNPQNSFNAVHISGSKGKGSAATLIAAGLRNAPFVDAPVGTYTSPHVEEVNERIRVNGVPIGDELLKRSLEEVLDARERPPLIQEATWFDVISATGLLSFHYSKVKWAAVEVGIGGRLDSTNVLSAPVSVITNIQLEHADIIGPALENIAYEKAGIIAPSSHCICGLSEDHELAHVFTAEASRVSPPATVHFCPHAPSWSLLDRNLQLARKALEQVALLEGSPHLSGELMLPRQLAISALAQLPARAERFQIACGGSMVSVILDGAHTKESVGQLLLEAHNERKPVVVLGLGEEKNRDAICKVVASKAAKVFATSAGQSEKYVSSAELGRSLQKANVSSTVVDVAEEALHEAIQEASAKRTTLVVIGSFYLAGRLRPRLRELHIQQ